MIKKIIAILIVVVIGSVATASCVVRNHVIQTVTPVIAAPVAVAVPAYGASYDDTAATAQLIRDLHKRVADAEARIASLEGKVVVLEAKVNGGGGNTPQPNPPPVPPPQPLPPAKAAVQPSIPALFARSCIKCHQQGKNPSGGLALVDDTGKNVMPLEGKSLKSVLRRINLPATDAKVMPPQKSTVPEAVRKVASDEEASEVLDVLTRP